MHGRWHETPSRAGSCIHFFMYIIFSAASWRGSFWQAKEGYLVCYTRLPSEDVSEEASRYSSARFVIIPALALLLSVCLILESQTCVFVQMAVHIWCVEPTRAPSGQTCSDVKQLFHRLASQCLHTGYSLLHFLFLLFSISFPMLFSWLSSSHSAAPKIHSNGETWSGVCIR